MTEDQINKMKKWNHPSMTILTSEQLKNSISACAFSDCIILYLR